MTLNSRRGRLCPIRWSLTGRGAGPPRLGLVAAGLGICLLPELAAPSVPEGVRTVRVEDPDWQGRLTLAVTRPGPSGEVRDVVDALEVVGRTIGAAVATPTS